VTDAPPLAPLTPRQREVFELLAVGCNYKQIGARLGNSCVTVKKLAHQGRQRLGVATNEAAIYLLRNEISINYGKE
jgi:DNA-binding NarL/FixJ family response regulator